MIKIIRTFKRLFATFPYLLSLKVGNNFRLSEGGRIHADKDSLSIGNDFFAGENFLLSNNKYAKIVIGHSVMCGPQVMFLGGNHDYSYTKNHLRYHQEHDINDLGIKVEDGVWIGARVTILSGALISEGAIIGANSLVNKYIPPYTIAVGSPAKVIKSRFSDKELKTLLSNVNSRYSFNEVIEEYLNCGVRRFE